jgi:hypothetical protein
MFNYYDWLLGLLTGILLGLVLSKFILTMTSLAYIFYL